MRFVNFFVGKISYLLRYEDDIMSQRMMKIFDLDFTPTSSVASSGCPWAISESACINND